MVITEHVRHVVDVYSAVATTPTITYKSDTAVIAISTAGADVRDASKYHFVCSSNLLRSTSEDVTAIDA